MDAHTPAAAVTAVAECATLDALGARVFPGTSRAGYN